MENLWNYTLIMSNDTTYVLETLKSWFKSSGTTKFYQVLSNQKP
jgi:hypothetical protein